MMLYYIYFVMTWCANFFLKVVLYRRKKIGKEDPSRYVEKLGRYKVERGPGRLVWFHVASVGELNSIIPLVQEIEKEVRVLITSITLNASKVFEKAHFKNAIHQFAPLDTPQIVKKFLQHWRPDAGVFIDSELWPNLLVMGSEQCNIINLNARLSDKSAQGWRRISSLAYYVYDRFTKILPCSLDDQGKIAEFCAEEKLKYIGNLKLVGHIVDPNPEELSALKHMFQGRVVIIAASTHPGEEEIVLDVYNKIRIKHPESFLIIAPRNTTRGPEIAQIAKMLGMKGKLRSDNVKPDLSDDIYIADTIGEMGLWYNISHIVIMGGSFVSVGGHNVIEPAQLGNAIIVGPYTYNFRDIIQEFVKRGAILVTDHKQLQSNLETLLNRPHYREELADRALKISDASEAILEDARDEVLAALEQ